MFERVLFVNKNIFWFIKIAKSFNHKNVIEEKDYKIMVFINLQWRSFEFKNKDFLKYREYFNIFI